MKSVKDILTWYGRLITNRPFLIIALMLVFTVAVSTQMSNLKMTSMETKSLLPKGDVVVEAMTFLENEFGGTDSGLVVVQIDPKENDSDEARDVRDYRVIEYMDVLSQKISKLEGVSSAKSAADLLKSPGTGRIPKEESTIQSTLSASSQSASYISKDYSMAD
jgi:predicted RND superfamily exporter protein